MVMPAGLFSLAHGLDRRGLSVRILHLGLISSPERPFDLPAYLKRHRPALVGLSLHWFYSTSEVLALAEEIKRSSPHARVVVGGYTASCFAETLCAQPAVDYVIRGDGEPALADLCSILMDADPHPPARLSERLAEVPNLVYASGPKRIRKNSLRCFDADLPDGQLSLFRPDLLEAASGYFSTSILYKDFDDRIVSNRRDLYSNVLFYTPGRGCPFDCSFCGGSRRVQQRLFARRKPFFFDTQTIVTDLQRAARHGVKTLRLSFDPDPERRRYREIFAALAKEKLRFRLVFDCWTLPRQDFVRSVQSCFTRDSLLVLSPDAGSAQIRARNKRHPAHAFSDQDLLDSLESVRDAGMGGHVFFGAGLPFEDASDLAATRRLALMIRKMGFHISVLPIDCDPCSAVFDDPRAFRVEARARSLDDYARWTATDRRFMGLASDTLSERQIAAFIDETVALLNRIPGP